MSRPSFALTAFSRLLAVASASASTASRMLEGTRMPSVFGSFRCWGGVLVFWCLTIFFQDRRGGTYTDDVNVLVFCLCA